MKAQEALDFARIAQAIEYIRHHFKRQPGLDELAHEVGLSTAHFQRLFTEWAGVSPKKFLQYISIEYAKKVLDETPRKENRDSKKEVAELFIIG